MTVVNAPSPLVQQLHDPHHLGTDSVVGGQAGDPGVVVAQSAQGARVLGPPHPFEQQRPDQARQRRA
jgi:hypothetical protein